MSESLIKKAAGVSSRVIDGRAVLVVMSRESLHSLNPSGTFLWSAIEDGRTRTGLRDALVNRYKVDPATADSDVDSFIEQLTELGALEVTTNG